jgi:hypothetical protein
MWEQRMGTSLTNKQYGQLRDLHKTLSDFTSDVITWLLVDAHWWHFGQSVVSQSGTYSPPPHPHVGFLLKHNRRALNFVRLQLGQSTDPTHVEFCRRLDRVRVADWKALVSVYSSGNPQWLAKITAADTITDLQRLFIEIIDADSTSSMTGAV